MVRDWNQDMWNWHQCEIIPSSICLLLATSENHTVRFTIIRRENVGLNIADLMATLILVTNTLRGKGGGDALCGKIEVNENSAGEKSTLRML